MNFEKFTSKSAQALEAAKSAANERGNQTIENLHFLFALLSDDGGLIAELVHSLGADERAFLSDVQGELDKLVRVSGAGYSSDRLYLSPTAEKMLKDSDKFRAELGDEYLSVEHIMLSLLESKDEKISALFKKYNIKKNEFLSALKKIRGNVKVTNENPEGMYNVLEKYGQDLVLLARQHKLDPVIGRDDEIRNVIRILSRKSKNNPCLIG